MLSLRRVAISLTNKCRKQCWFCYASAVPDGELFLSARDVIQLSNEISHFHPEVQFPLGGGEPTEHPELQEIIRFFEKQGIYYSITSNLQNIEPLRFVQRGYVYGSIHCPGEAEEVVEKVREFKNRGVNVLVSRGYFPEIYDVVDMLERKGIFYILTFLKPYGRAARGCFTNEIISKNEIRDFLKTLVYKYRHPIATESCLFIASGEQCRCGVEWITVTETGSLKPNSFYNKEVPLKGFSYKEFVEAYVSLDKRIHQKN